MGYLSRQMAVSDCGILDHGELLITYNLQIMKHLLILLFTACALLMHAQAPEGYPANYAKAPRFKVLIYYTQHAEEAHVQFAEQATTFFKKLNYGDGFVLDITTDFSKYPYEKLKAYNVIIMLNTSPNTKAERDAFEQYMENGGGWVGFHAAAYNDKNTHWPWFVKFLGGGVFYCNNWPPQPVLVEVDNEAHPVTKNLPTSFVAPASEWYQWTPSPRQKQGRRGTLVPVSQELSTGHQGCSEFWRLPHRMVQQELQNDLPKYGAW